MLHHFIRPDHLMKLLETQSLFLIRQDQQNDDLDGRLPARCFTHPHTNDTTKALGLSPEFLISQARAIDSLPSRTFIMSWTHSPTDRMRTEYGENGARCELQASALSLKRLLGYSWSRGCEFPPKSRPVKKAPGGETTAELKSPLYTDGTSAVPVVPSAVATGHKSERLSWEQEIRVSASIWPPHIEVGTLKIIQWPIESFAGLTISLGSKTETKKEACLRELAANRGVAVSGECLDRGQLSDNQAG